MAIGIKCKTVEVIPKQSVFYCSKQWCDRTFKKQINRLRHEKTCITKKYRKMCNICTKSFSRTSHLTRHMMTHESKSEYKCTKCQKCFRRKDRFDVHVSKCSNASSNPIINSTEYENLASTVIKDETTGIPIISSSDYRNTSLMVINNITLQHDVEISHSTDDISSHSNLPEVDTDASVSNYIIPDNSIETSNVDSQNKEDGKTCNLCKKSFSRRTTLRRHMVTHTNKPEYKYNECLSSYQRKDVFDNHVLRCENASNYPSISSSDNANLPSVVINNIATKNDKSSFYYGDVPSMVSNDDNTGCIPIILPSDYGNLPSMVNDNISLPCDVEDLYSNYIAPSHCNYSVISSKIPSHADDSTCRPDSEITTTAKEGSTPKENSKTCNVCKKTFTRNTNLRKHLMTHKCKPEYKCNKYQNSYQSKDTFDTYLSKSTNAGSNDVLSYFNYENHPPILINDNGSSNPTTYSDLENLPSMLINESTICIPIVIPSDYVNLTSTVIDANASNYLILNCDYGSLPSMVIDNITIACDVKVSHTVDVINTTSISSSDSNVSTQILQDIDGIKTSEGCSRPKKGTKTCNICKETFSRGTNLKKHLMTHKNIQDYKYNNCLNSYETKDIVDVNLLNNSPIKSSTGVTSSNLNSSVINTTNPSSSDDPIIPHNVSIKTPNTCTTKKGTRTCDICKKIFSRTTTLRRHMLIHKNKPSYKCDKCQSCYKSKDTFDVHLSKCSHKTNSPVQSTSDYGNLPLGIINDDTSNNHINLSDYENLPLLSSANVTDDIIPDNESIKTPKTTGGTKKATRTCNICKKVLSRTTTLRRHMLTHKNKPSYKCDKCQNCYQRKDKFDAHLSRCGDITNNPVQNTLDYSVPPVIIDSNTSNNHINLSDYDNLPSKGIDHISFSNNNIKFSNSTDVSLFQSNSLDINQTPPLSSANVTDDIIPGNECIKTPKTSDQPRKGTRTCNICNKTFSRTTTLRRHMIIHKKKPNYKCNKCQNCYQRKDIFDLHLSECSQTTKNQEINVFPYGNMSQLIVNGNASNNHVINSSDYENLPSKGIDDTDILHDIKFSNSTDLSLFQSNSLEINATSPSSSANVINHIPDNESIKTPETCGRPKKATRTCNICKKTFSRTTTLRRHMIIHKNKPNYKCNKCQNYYQGKNKFDIHVTKCSGNLVISSSDYGNQASMVIYDNPLPHDIISDCSNFPEVHTITPSSSDSIVSNHIIPDNDVIKSLNIYIKTMFPRRRFCS